MKPSTAIKTDILTNIVPNVAIEYRVGDIEKMEYEQLQDVIEACIRDIGDDEYQIEIYVNVLLNDISEDELFHEFEHHCATYKEFTNK